MHLISCPSISTGTPRSRRSGLINVKPRRLTTNLAFTTGHLAPAHFTQQTAPPPPSPYPIPVHLWPSPWPWSPLCAMRIPKEESGCKAKGRPWSQRKAAEAPGSWVAACPPPPHPFHPLNSQQSSLRPLAPGPRLGTKCCACATQWAWWELHVPKIPAACPACG